jgi:uncharacterized Zn finger protein
VRAKKGKPTTHTGECRLCGLRSEVEVNRWYHAARVRCFGCGGVMDRVFKPRATAASNWNPKPQPSPTPSKGEPPVKVRKRAVLTCKHCGRTREAGVLFCPGCRSPWVVTRGRASF